MKGSLKKAKLFEPIEVDKVVIRKDHYFSNAYIIDLPLDSVPDHVWQDIFEQRWKSSQLLWDRKIFVVGDKLRLVTSPDSIKDKLEWVKEAIEQTNYGIDDHNKNMEARGVQIDELEKQLTEHIREEEKATVEMIRDELRKRLRTL